MKDMFLSLATAVALLLMSAASYAQSMDAATTPTADASASQAATNRLEEITVTAERRSVNISAAPYQIQAFTQEDLEQRHIDSPNAIQQLVPSVKFIEVGNQPSLIIRGVGQPIANVFNDLSASFNIDGVTVVRPIAVNGLMFDLTWGIRGDIYF